MGILLIDNSNTRTKFALLEDSRMIAGVRVFPTADIQGEAVQALVADWTFSSVCLCSVVPWACSRLQAAFNCPVRLVDAALVPQLLKGYAGAATLGADRIANVLGVVQKGRFPAVAVDLGTASTFDVVEDGPLFLGGVISPGLQMMADALHERTSLLPPLDARAGFSRTIGKTTLEALHAGVALAFRGMVRETLQSVADELGQRPYVVATGGDASLLAACGGLFDEVDECLTINGIAAAALL